MQIFENMIRCKHSFLVDETHLKFPLSGKSEYCIENKFPIHYNTDTYIYQKKEVSITIESEENQPYIHRFSLKTKDSKTTFDGCSYAVQDILSKIDSFYDKLILDVSYLGNIMTVHDFENIASEWLSVKKYISRKYKGELVISYINKTDDLFRNEQNFINQLIQYQYLGGFIKPVYQKFTTEQSREISQPIRTKYGVVQAKETFTLDSFANPNDVSLSLYASYPEKNKLMEIFGNYIFENRENSWLKESKVEIFEGYGLHEYRSSFKILKQ